MKTTNPALWSEHFDLDLTRAPQRERVRLLGEIIKVGREAGIEIRHRAHGWSTTVDGETKNWWPAQANLFADYVADKARERL